MIEENFRLVGVKIKEALERSGRPKAQVKIMAVTKSVPGQVIKESIREGITLIGENRVQEARDKARDGAYDGATLCLIGHLQSNKASMAVRIFDEIHTVDSIKIARAISRFSLMYRKGRPMPVMVEVNVGKDPRKHGCLPEEALPLTQEILGLPGLSLKGLMTVAPGYGDAGMARDAFRRLRVLREELVSEGVPEDALAELSMGMSSDYEVAVEEGATMVRLGTVLFGPRACQEGHLG